jgi:hypothetical protein
VESDNLQLVEIHVEAVHGILTRCHFTDLLRAVRRNHATLLETVTAILGQRYGTYTQWRFAAREHTSMAQIQPVDWDAVRADLHRSDD